MPNLATTAERQLSSREIAELIALEVAREPDLRAAFMDASLDYARSLTRADERRKTAMQRAWADCTGGIDALRLELPRALAREAAEREAEAREHKTAARDRLAGLLRRLGEQEAAIVLAYEDHVLGGWRDVQQTLDELRQVLGFSLLLHRNGGALGDMLGDSRIKGLLEAQFWRLGAQVVYRGGHEFTTVAPGATAAPLHSDQRHNPDAVPSLGGQHRDLTKYALSEFDDEPLDRWLATPEPAAAPQSAAEPEPWAEQPADAPAAAMAPERPAAPDSLQFAEPGRPELPPLPAPAEPFSYEQAAAEIAARVSGGLSPLARLIDEGAAAVTQS